MTDRTDPTDPEVSPAEVLLVEERLRAVAVDVRPPEVDVADDVARGRRRVLRRRVVVLGAALATAGVVSAGALALGGDRTDGDRTDGGGMVATSPSGGTSAADPAPTGSSSPAPVRDTRDAKELLTDYRDVIAETLDPRGRHLQEVPDNLQSGGGLGTKLGWSNPGESGLGMVQVFVSGGWRSQFYLWCDRYQDCRDVTVGGIEARVLEEGGMTWVGVERADGTVAALGIDALFGNNSVEPVSGLDVSVADLARVAADERLTLATRQQIRGASKAFGFPDFP